MLVKATLTHMATLETLPVFWNPAGYRVSKGRHFAAPALLGSGLSPLSLSIGGEERFSTRLLFDASERTGPKRDLRALLEHLERWSEPEPGADLPSRLLFSWGSFRFRGYVEELVEEWIRFDPDGTPVRAWVDLTLRR